MKKLSNVRQNLDRCKVESSKQKILEAAIIVASEPGGWAKLTRDAVAIKAGCAQGLPSKYFGTMANFRRTIMRAAIKQANLQVIAQGLAQGDSCAKKAPPELKARAIEALAG